MPNAPFSVIDNKKCPFLTPSLACVSTGFGTVECLDRRFHEKCEHRAREESRKTKCAVRCTENRVH